MPTPLAMASAAASQTSERRESQRPSQKRHVLSGQSPKDEGQGECRDDWREPAVAVDVTERRRDETCAQGHTCADRGVEPEERVELVCADRLTLNHRYDHAAVFRELQKADDGEGDREDAEIFRRQEPGQDDGHGDVEAEIQRLRYEDGGSAADGPALQIVDVGGRRGRHCQDSGGRHPCDEAIQVPDFDSDKVGDRILIASRIGQKSEDLRLREHVPEENACADS